MLGTKEVHTLFTHTRCMPQMWAPRPNISRPETQVKGGNK